MTGGIIEMRKRRGASLLNVMVFLMFAVMVTAQVFFFSKSSSDSLAEEREIMVYRLNLNSLVEEAKGRLGEANTIVHKTDLDTEQLTYASFSNDAKIFDDSNVDVKWKNSGYHVRIYDLDYAFDGNSFSTAERIDWTTKYSGAYKHRKLFAAMPPIGTLEYDDEGNVKRNGIGKLIYDSVSERFYLIRVWTQLPENFFNAKLMYQVLVRRDNDEAINTTHNVDVLSFQEVWY